MSQHLPTTANEILHTCTPEQRRWVLFRLSSKSDKEAAKLAEVHPSTVSKWDNKDKLDLAVAFLFQEPINAALKILGETAIEAAEVLRALLRNKNASIRLKAAESILDRLGITSAQKHDIDLKVFDLEYWKIQRQKRVDEVTDT